MPSDKGERCPHGGHSHPDYGDGRCHPESQQHRDGEHHEERGGRREQRRDEQGNEEERKAAVLKRITSRGVKVEEIEQAHPSVLENVDAGLEEAIKHGAAVPDGIVVDSSYFEGRDILSRFAVYRGEQDTIVVNPRSKLFRAGMADARYFMGTYKEKRFTSTDSVMHAIRHELSHCAHWHHDQRSYKVKEFEDPSHRELAGSQVSRYAAQDPQEFVAEVRAALLDGKGFSDEVMKLYSHYSGGLDR